MNLLENFKAGHVGQTKIEHCTIETFALERCKSRAPAIYHFNINVVMPQKSADTDLLGWIVFHDEQLFPARCGELLEAINRPAQFRRSCRFNHISKGSARQAMMPAVIHREHLHRDVASRRILLEMIQDGPPQHVRQEDIQRYGGRAKFASESKRLRSPHRDQYLEALLPGHISQQTSKKGIVFYDKQSVVTGLNTLAVIVYVIDNLLRRRRRQA